MYRHLQVHRHIQTHAHTHTQTQHTTQHTAIHHPEARQEATDLLKLILVLILIERTHTHVDLKQLPSGVKRWHHTETTDTDKRRPYPLRFSCQFGGERLGSSGHGAIQHDCIALTQVHRGADLA